MAPAAKASRYGIKGVTADASSSTNAPPIGSTIPLRLPIPKAFQRLFPAARSGMEMMAPSAGSPKVFFRYFFVNTATGEKSGDVLAQAKLTNE